MSNNEPDVFRSHPARLAQLLELEPEGGLAWREDELAAVWRHQLAAPIEIQAPSSTVSAPVEPDSASTPAPATIALLCQDPHPPLALLHATKQFAQAHLDHRHSDLPRAIAEVIYYLSIALARSRLGERITRLPEAEVARGIDWALTLPWLDPLSREALALTRPCFAPSAASPSPTPTSSPPTPRAPKTSD